MSTKAISGVGVKLQWFNGTDWIVLAEVLSVEQSSVSRDVLEITNEEAVDGFKQFIPSMVKDGGIVNLSLNFTRDTFNEFHQAFSDDIYRICRIQFPTKVGEPSHTISISGIVIDVDALNIATDSQIINNVTFKATKSVEGGGGTGTELYAPINLRIINQTVSNLTLVWDDTNLGSAYYRIETSVDNIVWITHSITLMGANIYHISNLAQHINYYRVRAWDGESISDASNEVSTWLKFLIRPRGDHSGVTSLNLTTSENQTISLVGDALFYTDIAGTLNSDTSWQLQSPNAQIRHIRCASDSILVIEKPDKIIKWGDVTGSYSGWLGRDTNNSSEIIADVSSMSLLQELHLGLSTSSFIHLSGKLPDTLLKMIISTTIGTWNYIGALPVGLTHLALYGPNCSWTYEGPLPIGLTTLSIDGHTFHWTYEGALPSGLTFTALQGENLNWTYEGPPPPNSTRFDLNGLYNIHWTYNGPLPSGLTRIQLRGMNINWTYTGALPSGLTYVYIFGDNINWTYTGALPSGLTSLYIVSQSIYWTYTGVLPSGINNLCSLQGENIYWTYNGALPSAAERISLNGENIYWTYTGALSSSVTELTLHGANINWTYNGPLPSNMTILNLNANVNWTYNGPLPETMRTISIRQRGQFNWTYSGALPDIMRSCVFDNNYIDWTGLDIGDKGVYTLFSLLKYRQSKMSSADLLTLLTQMRTRTGGINVVNLNLREYADYSSPPQYILEAVNALKNAKNITSVNLGS